MSLAAKFQVKDSKLYSTPMESYLKIEKAEECEPSIKYRNLIGALLYRRLDARTPYLGTWFKNALSQRPIEERPISASSSRTTYLGARSKNDLSRRPVEERPISAPG